MVTFTATVFTNRNTFWRNEYNVSIDTLFSFFLKIRLLWVWSPLLPVLSGDGGDYIGICLQKSMDFPHFWRFWHWAFFEFFHSYDICTNFCLIFVKYLYVFSFRFLRKYYIFVKCDCVKKESIFVGSFLCKLNICFLYCCNDLSSCCTGCRRT